MILTKLLILLVFNMLKFLFEIPVFYLKIRKVLKSDFVILIFVDFVVYKFINKFEIGHCFYVYFCFIF